MKPDPVVLDTTAVQALAEMGDDAIEPVVWLAFSPDEVKRLHRMAVTGGSSIFEAMFMEAIEQAARNKQEMEMASA